MQKHMAVFLGCMMILSACAANQNVAVETTMQETTMQETTVQESSEAASQSESEMDLQNELLQEYAREKYEDACESVDYRDLIRYEKEMSGRKVYLYATIVSVAEGTFNCVDAYGDIYSIHDTREYDKTKVLVDDQVHIYGEAAGVAMATRAADGTTEEIPQINVKYIDFNGVASEQEKAAATATTTAAVVQPQNNITYDTMYVVNCNASITLRTSPSTKASEIRQIPLGEAVSYIEGAANGFYKVSYMGDTGYALASYLSYSAPSAAPVYSTMKVVNCKESITLRTSPSTSASEICQIPLYSVVSYIEPAANGFYKVSYLGRTGYALASYLE